MARILCVDGDEDAVDMRRANLERAGYRVDVSTSVRDAIQQLSSSPYDAMITDWRIGLESARSVIAAARLRRKMPVVVISGFVAEAFQSSGPVADLYLDKPVNPVELIEILEVLLREHSLALHPSKANRPLA